MFFFRGENMWTVRRGVATIALASWDCHVQITSSATTSRRCWGSDMVLRFWKMHIVFGAYIKTMLGGGFKYFVIFTPIWGRFPVWLIFFKWVVQPPTSKKNMSFSGCWFVFMEVELQGKSHDVTFFVCTKSSEWIIEISWFKLTTLTAEHISYRGGGNVEFLLWFKLWNIFMPEHASFETYICHGLLCILFMHAHHNFCTLHKSAIGIHGLLQPKKPMACVQVALLSQGVRRELGWQELVQQLGPAWWKNNWVDFEWRGPREV